MENDKLNTLIDATIDLAMENYWLDDPNGADAPAFRARCQAIRILQREIFDLRMAAGLLPEISVRVELAGGAALL